MKAENAIVVAASESSDDILGVGVTIDDVFSRQRNPPFCHAHIAGICLNRSVGSRRTQLQRDQCVHVMVCSFSGKGLLQLLISIIIIT